LSVLPVVLLVLDRQYFLPQQGRVSPKLPTASLRGAEVCYLDVLRAHLRQVQQQVQQV
jgi:hypothetical protein